MNKLLKFMGFKIRIDDCTIDDINTFLSINSNAVYLPEIKAVSAVVPEEMSSEESSTNS